MSDRPEFRDYDPALANAPCVKCGERHSRKGRSLLHIPGHPAGESYEAMEEHLMWDCIGCGHALRSRCADYPSAQTGE